jgi:hypothetical protein
MKPQALDAIAAAILVHRAARKQLEKIIAIRKAKRQNVDEERNLKATVSRKIGNLRDLEVELKAAGSVASAPTVNEIRQVKDLVARINGLATTDAARAATLAFLKQAVGTASNLSGKVKIA